MSLPSDAERAAQAAGLMSMVLERLCASESLTMGESEGLFRKIVEGTVEAPMLAAILTALKAKGETAAEIAGAARALRASAEPFEAPAHPVADTCGTGGDGAASFNVSTAVAFVAAAGGVPVVKHGNRSVSSRCGSADVLEALGLRIDLDGAAARKALDATGFCFLFAPRMHPGVRHAMPVRKALGVRTIFNVLGPLANPARPAHQVLGTGVGAWVLPMAETLRLLGSTAALVVHGSGMDEIALHGETRAARLFEGKITELTITPEDVGLARAPADALRGGDPAENAAALRAVLQGQGTQAQRDAVAFNAGAVLWTTGASSSLREGVARAVDLVRSGAGEKVLESYREASHDFPTG